MKSETLPTFLNFPLFNSVPKMASLEKVRKVVPIISVGGRSKFNWFFTPPVAKCILLSSMANAKVPVEELSSPPEEVATGGNPKMGARRSSVKNLIKIFQPISQEEKLARLSGPAPESTSPAKATSTAPRNLNGSVRYVDVDAPKPPCKVYWAAFRVFCFFTPS